MVSCISSAGELYVAGLILVGLLMDLAVIFVDIAVGKNHTFRELRDTSEQIGRGLRYQWGWQKGDVMALFAPNSADIGAIAFGTHWAGGIVCPTIPPPE